METRESSAWVRTYVLSTGHRIEVRVFRRPGAADVYRARLIDVVRPPLRRAYSRRLRKTGQR